MILGRYRKAARYFAAENVLVEAHLNRRQRRVARVVQVDCFAAGQGRGRGIESSGDGVVDSQLPILPAWTSARVTCTSGERSPDAVRERNVAANGSIRRSFDGNRK